MLWRCVPSSIPLTIALGVFMPAVSDAAFATSITSDGTLPVPTSVSKSSNLYNINGGTIRGSNLFHSFGLFSVGTGDIASFNGPGGIANILSRVTGGRQSIIDGQLRSAIAGANLYLMNPAGVLFGPNATLNLSGSFHVTTADYLRLTDNVQFTAKPDVVKDSLLTTAPVAAFGFVNTNPAAISVQGSVLQVPPGQTLSLVGGDVMMAGARVSAPSGLIQIASAASPGEVVSSLVGPIPSLDVISFTSLGRIGLLGSAVDVSGLAGGIVLIRSGQLVLSNSIIKANTVGTNSGGISIAASNFQMDGGVIQADTGGPGNAGNITVNADSLSLTGGALITSTTAGTGQGGTVTVQAGKTVSISGETPGPVTVGPATLPFLPSGIYTATFAGGSGGRISVSAPVLRLDGGALDVDNYGPGGAGNITVDVGKLILTGGGALSAGTYGVGPKGNITVRATDSIVMSGFRPGLFPSAAGLTYVNVQSGIYGNNTGIGPNFGGGLLSVKTPFLSMDHGVINATSGGPRNASDIFVDVGILILTGGAFIASATFGSGQGGNVTVQATDSISTSGRSAGSFTTGLVTFTNNESGLYSVTFDAGHAGRISVSAPTLLMHDGGLITAASGGSGPAGDVTVNVGNLALTDGAQIISGSGTTIGNVFFVGAGQGGTVSVRAADTVSISGHGTGLFTNAVGNGAGGNVNLEGTRILLNAGAMISAKSSGLGNAGNINITAADRFVMKDGTVTTQATLADGGNITIRAGELFQLTNSSITTSVGTGAGNGGNISIDPQFFIVDHSRILANAFGGKGGNITMTAGVFLASPDSIIDASSALGVNGVVAIQSPVQNLSGTLSPLPSSLLTIAPLTSQCAARAQGGTFSSFTVPGRDGVPVEPGGLLPSPISEAGEARTAGPSPGNSVLVALNLARETLDGACTR
jgi:filamentous hemagglutinin family protein